MTKENDGTIVVRKVMCKTCPFNETSGEGWSFLKPVLIEKVLSVGSPLCHSTTSMNGELLSTDEEIKAAGLKPKYCRGAREFAISFLFSIGFLESPTEKAWNKKKEELDANYG